MTLNQVRITAANFERCHRFYEDVLGLDPLWGDATSDYAGFHLDEGPSLALQRAPSGTSTGPHDRVVLIFTVEDLDSSVRNLKALGVEFISAPLDRPEWGVRVAQLRDPEGNLIEYHEPLPREQWTGEFRRAVERRERRR